MNFRRIHIVFLSLLLSALVVSCGEDELTPAESVAVKETKTVPFRDGVFRVMKDTNIIRFGEEIKLTLMFDYIDQDGKAAIGWPGISMDDTLAKVFEIKDISEIKTIYPAESNETKIRKVQELTLTGFIPGHFPLLPFEIAYNNDTIMSDAHLLSVLDEQNVDVDKAIKDIKDIYNDD